MRTYIVPRNGLRTSKDAREFGHDHISSDTFQRILVPLDGSEVAEQALPLAIELAQHDGAILGLVRVVPAGSTAAENGNRAQIEHLRDEARNYLDGVAGTLRARGIRATWEVRIGAPGEEIARAAATTAADIIVMASSHYVTGKNAVVSVTDAAIRATNIPVIITPQTTSATTPGSAH